MRKSGIELLKIFAVFLIVLSHIIQSLYQKSSVVDLSTDYLINLDLSTTNISVLLLIFGIYGGAFGNVIFITCSSYFLINARNSYRKILVILLDVWLLTVIPTLIFLIVRNGDITRPILLQSFFPTFYNIFWFATCYMFILIIYPLLNIVISKISRIHLLILSCFLFLGYSVISTFISFPMYSNLLLWISIYFAMAYLKIYKPAFNENMKVNILLVVISTICFVFSVLFVNFVGLKVEWFSDKNLYWNKSCNFLLVFIAIGLFNICNHLNFKNRFINTISSTSLFVYIIHQNPTFKLYYRPMIWEWLYQNCGYNYVVLLALGFALAVFSGCIIISLLYKYTLHKIVVIVSNKINNLIFSGISKLNNKLQ